MIISPCVLWTKAKDKAGYGVSWLNGKWIRAHRKAYIEVYGDIPRELIVRHKCDNRGCVNPEHLEIGTHKQNSEDMTSRNRQAKGTKCGSTKLAEVDVMLILDLFGNASSRNVAKSFNISKTNVLDIWNRRIWKHL